MRVTTSLRFHKILLTRNHFLPKIFQSRSDTFSALVANKTELPDARSWQFYLCKQTHWSRRAITARRTGFIRTRRHLEHSYTHSNHHQCPEQIHTLVAYQMGKDGRSVEYRLFSTCLHQSGRKCAGTTSKYSSPCCLVNSTLHCRLFRNIIYLKLLVYSLNARVIV